MTVRIARGRRRRRHRSHAFTLMEMVTSCIVISLLMMSLGYALKLALVSTGNGAAQAVATLDAGDVVGRITDDLNEAINFTEKTATSVTFTVPDRDGDGNVEKLRYVWWPTAGTYTIPGSGGGSGSGGSSSGGGGLLGGLLGGVLGLLGGTTTASNGDTVVSVPAYTLTRQRNDGEVAVLGKDVRQFALNYLYRSMSPPSSAASGTTEKLLWSYDAPAGLTVTYKDFQLNDRRLMGCIFTPYTLLPVGTSSFSITRISVQLQLDVSPYEGVVKCSVRPMAGSYPSTSSVVERSATQVLEVSLNDSYLWVDFPFIACKGLSAAVGQKYAFVVEGINGGSTTIYSAQVGYAAPLLGVGIPSGTTWAQTLSGGVSGSPPWTTNASHSLRYRVYGTTTP
jgi:hypothetical protein